MACKIRKKKFHKTAVFISVRNFEPENNLNQFHPLQLEDKSLEEDETAVLYCKKKMKWRLDLVRHSAVRMKNVSYRSVLTTSWEAKANSQFGVTCTLRTQNPYRLFRYTVGYRIQRILYPTVLLIKWRSQKMTWQERKRESRRNE